MDLAGSRLLITGAHGCIGAWITKLALDGGADVIAFDVATDPWRLRLISPEYDKKRLLLVEGRVDDTAKVKALVKDSGVTHIAHMAAVLMPFCASNPVEGGMINVIGTLNVFEGARDAGRNIRITYASSSAVWGPKDAYENRRLTENDPLKPATHYGVFKQCNEGNARAFYAQNGISSISLRPWTVYGPGRDTGLTADPTLAMKAVAEGKPFHIRTSGRMDLQYVEDIAGAFLAGLYSNLEGAHIFNVEGDIVEMSELIDLLAQVRPEAKKLITFGGPEVPVAFQMDGSQLRTKVPGVPQTKILDGIRKSIDFFAQAQ